MKNYFSTLSFDIIQSHLIPNLAQTDRLSLAAADRTLFETLRFMRIPIAPVQNERGFILDILSSATLKSIEHLIVNGSHAQNDLVFTSQQLDWVQSATVRSRITPGQAVNFKQFAQNLTTLTEENDPDGNAEHTSSLSVVPDGAFQNLRLLRFKICLPTNIESQLTLANNLTILQYFPTINTPSLEGYQTLANELITLYGALSNRAQVPALKILQAPPTTADLPTQQPVRDKVFEALWAAIARHGGWRILACIPSSEIVYQNPVAWEFWEMSRIWDLHISVEELQSFEVWCTARGRYPRIDEFVRGRIHLHVHGQEESLEIGCMNLIYGISISTGAPHYFRRALELVVNETRMVTISLESNWGPAELSEQINSDRFQGVEALTVVGSTLSYPTRPEDYSRNIGASLLRALSVSKWPNLVHLSLAASTFQAPQTEYNRRLGSCGIHIGAYELGWLKNCLSLKAISLTAWKACYKCHVDEDYTLEGGLVHLPPSVEFVFFNGHFRCPQAEKAKWVKLITFNVMQALKWKSPDIVVRLGRVRFGPF